MPERQGSRRIANSLEQVTTPGKPGVGEPRIERTAERAATLPTVTSSGDAQNRCNWPSVTSPTMRPLNEITARGFADVHKCRQAPHSELSGVAFVLVEVHHANIAAELLQGFDSRLHHVAVIAAFTPRNLNHVICFGGTREQQGNQAKQCRHTNQETGCLWLCQSWD